MTLHQLLAAHPKAVEAIDDLRNRGYTPKLSEYTPAYAAKAIREYAWNNGYGDDAYTLDIGPLLSAIEAKLAADATTPVREYQIGDCRNGIYAFAERTRCTNPSEVEVFPVGSNEHHHVKALEFVATLVDKIGYLYGPSGDRVFHSACERSLGALSAAVRSEIRRLRAEVGRKGDGDAK